MKFGDHVECGMSGAVGVVAIDNPPVNSLGRSVAQGLRESFAYLEKQGAGAVILTGKGRIFVAGADLKEMLAAGDALAPFSEDGHRLFSLIEHFPVPTIAAVNGAALGGGLELAICCDILLAAENAKLGLPETGLGLVPGWGGLSRLPKIIGIGNAKKLVFSAEHITAPQALAMGLVHEVLPQDTLMDRAMELAVKITKNSPLAVREAKKALNAARETPLHAATERETEAFCRCGNSPDKAEGIDAFFNKRAPAFGRP